MSTRRREWISKRGQADVAGAIDQVLDRQPGEHVQQLDDTQIEDSPFQARRPFDGTSVEDLAQGMREMGFQGVLIVRPHGELPERRRGLYQLVYGHRRRAAWRHVCAERGERCVLPVVIREISDERMLTIGAQENLQREDLDPIEEAQIVAWHQHMFSDKNQAEIGAMLGKSSDWVSVRARIFKLPDALKDRLRLRPRAISQILELSTLADEHSAEAFVLADRIVAENLTLEAVRTLLRGYVRPARAGRKVREAEHNRRGAATSVREITNSVSEVSVACDTSDALVRQPVTTEHPVVNSPASAQVLSLPVSDKHSLLEQSPNIARRDVDAESSDSLTLLRNAATALATIAARSNDLPLSTSATLALDQAERALTQVRSVLTRLALAQTEITSTHYQLVDTDLQDILVRLLGHRPILVTLRAGQSPNTAVKVVMFMQQHTFEQSIAKDREQSQQELRQLVARVKALEERIGGTITREQRGYIYQLVQLWGAARARIERRTTSETMSACWGALKARYRLAKYDQLPIHLYDDCVQYVEQQYQRLTGEELRLPEQCDLGLE